MSRAAAAIAVGLAAFWIYQATLLPGFDFGDTGSFQATVGSPIITPRDGYPLYFAIGNAFVRATGLEPARALNLASAIEGGAAGALIVLAGAELCGSVAAGVAAALLFGTSYTFWSQAIIAEVYALHAVFVAATLLLLLRWERRPTTARLACFFAAYALGFGNHLSMVLLLPGYTVFLLVAAPGGWRSMLRPRIVILAAAIACLGAAQYLWNLHGLWIMPDAPHSAGEALATFWFDVTKTDWRETMVMRVPGSVWTARLAMYWFDVRQQFGWAVLLAPLGFIALFSSAPRRGLLLLLLYAVNVLFALTYNVGDVHVFFLPSHLMLALAIAWFTRFGRFQGLPAMARFTALALIAFGVWQGYDNFPALDRSGDRRPTRVLAELTAGIDDRSSVLLADLNWQIQNGLAYYAKWTNPAVAYARAPDVLLYAPALVRDNVNNGRDVMLTERAAAGIRAAYGPLLPIDRDPAVATPSLAEIVDRIPPGTRYALTILKPTRESAIDLADLTAALEHLTGRRGLAVPHEDYVAVAGIVGETPVVSLGSSMPFRQQVDVGGVAVQVRMESWLATDTIRRMGFGQIVAARRHTLIVERGISFAAFDAHGIAITTAYAANIFAAQPRFIVRRPLPF